MPPVTMGSHSRVVIHFMCSACGLGYQGVEPALYAVKTTSLIEGDVLNQPAPNVAVALRPEAFLKFKSILLNYFRQINPETSRFGVCGVFSNNLRDVLVNVGRNAEVRKVGVRVSDELRTLLTKRYSTHPSKVRVQKGTAILEYYSTPGVMIISGDVVQEDIEDCLQHFVVCTDSS